MRRTGAILTMVLAGLAAAPAQSADKHEPPRMAGEKTPLQLAQLDLRIQLGVPNAVVWRSLRREGYSDIEVYERGLTKARAFACREGVRWRVQVKPNGRVAVIGQAGTCRRRIGLAVPSLVLRRSAGQAEQDDRFGFAQRRLLSCDARVESPAVTADGVMQ